MSNDWLLNAVTATTIAGLMGAVAAGLSYRASAAARHLVWTATLAAFVATPLLVTLAGALGVRRVEVAVPVLAVASAPPAGQVAAGPSAMAFTPEPVPNAAPPQPPDLPSTGTVLSFIWLAGMLVSAGSLLRQWRAVRLLRRSAVPLGDADVTDRLGVWARGMGLPAAPAVAVSPLVAVPTVLGWRNPTVLLPRDVPADAGAEACLLHELAHIVRRDAPRLVAGRLIALVWWWHPLYWLAVRGLRETAEQACDDWAVALSGKPRSYAAMLVGYAAEATGIAGLACSARGRALTRRVRRILGHSGIPALRLSRSVKVAVLLAGLVVALAACAVGVRAVPAGRQQRQKAHAVAATPTLRQSLTIRFGEPLHPGGVTVSSADGPQPVLATGEWLGPKGYVPEHPRLAGDTVEGVALPPRAAAKLGLCVHVVAASSIPEPTPAAVPPGHKVLTYFGRQFAVRSQPDLTAADIRELRWRPSLLIADERGRLGGGPTLEIEFHDPKRLLSLAQEAIADVASQPPPATPSLAPKDPFFIVVSGDEVLGAPHGVGTALGVWRPVSLPIAFTDLTREQQRELLPYVKGLPCSEGLPLGNDGAKALPGMATVTLKAHFADGSAALIDPPGFRPALRHGEALWPLVVPTMQGRGSEWAVTNVSPGNWHYRITGEDVSLTMNLIGMVTVKAGEHLSRDIEVHKGGTVTGRVVRAEDGQPVAGAEVYASTRVCRTGSDGRYTLARVPPDGSLIVEADGFVPKRVPGPLRVADGGRISLPDARLDRGGWIVGTVERRDDMPKDVRWMGYVLPEGPGADRVIEHMYQRDPLGQDLSFRVGPLPAGTYALNAQIGSHELDAATGTRHRWQGSVKGIRVRVGQEARDVRIAVAPVASP